MKKKKYLVGKMASISALAWAATTAGAQELTIDWGTDLFPSGPLITSTGSALSLGDGSYTDGGFTIELGAFDGGFTPTSSNIGSWVGNWKVFDAITAGDPDPSDNLIFSSGSSGTFGASDLLNSSNESLSADASVDSNYVFSEGTQAYVFIRNGNDPVPGTEWLLYTRSSGTDAWEYPFVPPETHSAADDLEWSISDAVSPVWGGINGVDIGEGERTFVDNSVLAQTFTFSASSVPEPSSLMLGALSCLFLLRRRR